MVYAIWVAGPNSLLVRFLLNDKAAVVRLLAQGEKPQVKILDERLPSAAHAEFSVSYLTPADFAKASVWRLPWDKEELPGARSPLWFTRESEMNAMMRGPVTFKFSIRAEERLRGVPDEFRKRFIRFFVPVMWIFKRGHYPDELRRLILNEWPIYREEG